MRPLPGEFIARINGCFPEQGAAWLSGLRSQLSRIARGWNLTILAPCDLSYNFVCHVARQDRTRAILKLVVDARDFAREVSALEAFAGDGVVRLLDHDERERAILLERVTPGTPLAHSDLDDLARTRVLASAIQTLRDRGATLVSAGEGAQRSKNWSETFERVRDRARGVIPAELYDRAEEVCGALSRAEHTPHLLHGDLHHYNILSAGDGGWVVIDPKGFVGAPGYEYGALLCNPHGLTARDDLEEVTRQRVALLSSLCHDEEVCIAAWGLVQSVLSMIWSIEDSETGWEGNIRLARCFARMLGAGQEC